MRPAAWQRGGIELFTGDAREVMREMPEGSVQCCVTSPPYWGLRDYGVPGQLGLEATPEEYVARMVEVFREVRRVLRDDGTLWLNLGDCYANTGKSGGGDQGRRWADHGGRCEEWAGTFKPAPPGLKPKDLIGIPWMVAFALRADGWWLRADCIWHHVNCMPESVTDRPTKAHSYVFLLTKSASYFYDAEAVKEPAVCGNHHRTIFDNGPQQTPPGTSPHRGLRHAPNAEAGRNLRSVWAIASRPFKGAHFATFPPALPERCVKAGTSERGACAECGAPWERVVERKFVPQQDVSEAKGRRGAGERKPMDASNSWEGYPRGTTRATTIGWRPGCDCGAPAVPCRVLDPFSGAGTTAMVAHALGRSAWGIELSPAYTKMSEERLGDAIKAVQAAQAPLARRRK